MTSGIAMVVAFLAMLAGLVMAVAAGLAWFARPSASLLLPTGAGALLVVCGLALLLLAEMRDDLREIARKGRGRKDGA